MPDDKAPAPSNPEENENPSAGQGREGDENDTSAYVGVDPVYQNYADETLRPLTAEEGPEKYYDKLAQDQQAEAAERAKKIGVTGFTGSVGGNQVVLNAPGSDERAKELADAQKAQAKQQKELDKQREQAREARRSGAQV